MLSFTKCAQVPQFSSLLLIGLTLCVGCKPHTPVGPGEVAVPAAAQNTVVVRWMFHAGPYYQDSRTGAYCKLEGGTDPSANNCFFQDIYVQVIDSCAQKATFEVGNLYVNFSWANGPQWSGAPAFAGTAGLPPDPIQPVQPKTWYLQNTGQVNFGIRVPVPAQPVQSGPWQSAVLGYKGGIPGCKITFENAGDVPSPAAITM